VESAEDDYSHGVLDLMAGPIAANDDGEKRECRSGCCHEDRHQALFGSAHDHIAAERLSFLLLKMPVVADQHHAIPSRNSEHWVLRGGAREQNECGRRPSAKNPLGACQLPDPKATENAECTHPTNHRTIRSVPGGQIFFGCWFSVQWCFSP
jgi:hypothetical protein